MAYGDPVDKEQALQIAKAFVSKRHTSGGHLTLSYCEKKASNASPGYYVFNKDTKDGFVIVSGDNCSPQILGYSDEGTFSPDDIPEGLRYLLDWYGEELALARQQAPTPSHNAANTASSSQPRQPIAPLLDTTWDQRAPYNHKCLMANGKQSYAGCVATAMAQVMKYHEWPQGSTSTIPEYTASNDMDYDALSPTTFDWDKMKNAYAPLAEGETADASLEEMADLMLYCGHSVKMNYATGGAGASTSLIPEALNTYFGYSDEARQISRINYNNEVWCDIIYNELINLRPVLYAGDTSTSISHIFICDGYDGNGLFHINWGAGGKSNGYFNLNSLRPSVLSAEHSAFDNKQRIILGIHPPTNEVDPSSTYLATTSLSTTEATYSFDSSNTINKTINFSITGVVNLVYADAAICLCQDNKVLETLYSIPNLYVIRDTTIIKKVTYSFKKGLSDGLYQIVGMNRLPGETEWRLNADTDSHHIELEVKDGKYTFTTVNSTSGGDTSPSLRIVSVNQVFESGVNPKQIRVVMRNVSTVDFRGTAYLILNNDYSLYEGCFIDAGDTTSLDFYTTKAAGTYTCKIQGVGNNFNRIYDRGTLKLTDKGSLPKLTMEELSFKNTDGDILYGKVLDGKIRLRNNTSTDYRGLFSFFIYHEDIDEKSLMSQIVSIKAGEVAEIPIYFENLVFGEKISIVDIGDPYTIYQASTTTWTITPGLVTWSASGERKVSPPSLFIDIPEDAAAVSFEGLTPTRVSPNNNENTIYYFDNDAIVPYSFTNKNVVLGNKAEKIRLVEGKDFFIPSTFHAKDISYSRTPTMAYDGKRGWQTIVLPFSVDSIHDSASHGGRALSWSIDTKPKLEGKDIWLRELNSIKGDNAYFNSLNYWRPNTPYLFAVPDDLWGPSCNLVGHTLTFSSKDAMVLKTNTMKVICNGYEFTGATGNNTLASAYVLNELGDAFTLASTSAITPASAYLLPMHLQANAPSSIHIFNPVANPGDVNGDNEVNISDVMCIVDFILGRKMEFFIKANADLNDSNDIDVSDIMLEVWLILH